MQAVILAAGKGSRLFPITTRRSKAMLPILGKPIIERVMEPLETNGVADFILVVNPDDRIIARHFHFETQTRSNIRLVTQPHQRGMADALRCATPLITGDFILAACDNLIPGNHISLMLALWQSEQQPNAILTLMPVEADQISSAGIVALEGSWVTQIIEKPDPAQAPSNIASLPLYCLPYEILKYLPDIKISKRGEYELQDALQMLIERRGRVFGLQVEKRFSLTRPSDLLEINWHFLNAGETDIKIQPQSIGQNTCLKPPLYIESGSKIGNNCLIGPNVFIERDCRIGDNVRLENVILLRRSTVNDHQNISNQIFVP